MRTRLRICLQKKAFATEGEAVEALLRSGLDLRPYRCDRCRRFHLTSRRKGKRRVRRPG